MNPVSSASPRTSDSWTSRRQDATAESILSAAEHLFSEQGPGRVSMAQVAAAAGCSRATLYRHFENRRALQVAFAGREARDLLAAAARAVDSSTEDRTTAVLTRLLAEIRSRPTLDAWISPDHQGELLSLLLEAPWLSALTGSQDPEATEWLLRSLMGLLACPADPDRETALIRRFITPWAPTP